ncbi:MAG: ATP-dependent RNA helicase DeaD [Phycisphaerae bacterium]|nr:ATP-dependent RNA helicase DeaD [Phycisphaerae bacterium]
MPAMDSLLAALKEHFGFDAFRPGQREVIEAVLAGRDALAVHPTGAGKSLMYQLPAVAGGPGLALVVSPLIALMQDQVDALRRRGLAAAFVNSTLSAHERREVWSDVADGSVRLLYAAPEQFATAGFAERLSRAGCRLLVIDEAHCISQWGHDFRPDYARIDRLIAQLSPRPAVLAVTATATARVRKEIAELLRMRNPQVSLRGVYRPNLRIAVRTDAGKHERIEAMLRVAAWARGGSVIVYAGTRSRSDELADVLRGAGHRAESYHAGLDAAARATRQDRFNAGDTPIICATNAFGMGIDKPDIRAVVHYRLPESLEAYYQEIGRAGRDGRQALCLGFLGPGDVNQLGFMVRSNNPFPSFVEREYRDLRARTGGGPGPIDWPYADLPRNETNDKRIICNFLSRFGAIGLDRGRITLDPDWPGLADHERSWMEAKRGLDLDRLGQVEAFARERHCRMLSLQAYFGFADLRQPCGHCDVCAPKEVKAVAPAAGRGAAKRKRRKKSVAAAPRATVEDLTSSADSALFERLREWRFSEAAGKPAYTVCTDRTLIDLVRRRPASAAELAEVHGIGPTRARRYGAALLGILREAK